MIARQALLEQREERARDQAQVEEVLQGVADPAAPEGGEPPARAQQGVEALVLQAGQPGFRDGRGRGGARARIEQRHFAEQLADREQTSAFVTDTLAQFVVAGRGQSRGAPAGLHLSRAA